MKTAGEVAAGGTPVFFEVKVKKKSLDVTYVQFKSCQTSSCVAQRFVQAVSGSGVHIPPEAAVLKEPAHEETLHLRQSKRGRLPAEAAALWSQLLSETVRRKQRLTLALQNMRGNQQNQGIFT